MSAKAVCVLKSEQVNGVVHFIQEVGAIITLNTFFRQTNFLLV